MAKTLSKADVKTPTVDYLNARVELHDDDTASVYNNQTDELLTTLSGVGVIKANDRWQADNDTIIISRCGSCGSGLTVVKEHT